MDFLELTLEALQNEFAKLQAEKAKLEADLAASKNGAELKKLKEQLDEATKLNESLSEELEKAQISKKTGFPILKLGKDSYSLIVPKFNYEGKEVTEEVLKENEALLKELVEKGIGTLQKVV